MYNMAPRSIHGKLHQNFLQFLHKRRPARRRGAQREPVACHIESLETRALLSSSPLTEIVVDNRDDSGFSITGKWRESGGVDEYAGSSVYSTKSGDTAT